MAGWWHIAECSLPDSEDYRRAFGFRSITSARNQRLASGPHPGEPTPQEVREQGTKFRVGTPDDCLRLLELYEALGIEEVILLCAVGPAQHQEVLHTLRLFGERVIPHFRAKEPRVQVARASA
jgi:alkanesulfonate monooxygenase SsuD/methylene tetrahydromethanopterin reductase-like flavin-dependent oxidoreductase (luciferase family)